MLLAARSKVICGLVLYRYLLLDGPYTDLYRGHESVQKERGREAAMATERNDVHENVFRHSSVVKASSTDWTPPVIESAGGGDAVRARLRPSPTVRSLWDPSRGFRLCYVMLCYVTGLK